MFICAEINPELSGETNLRTIEYCKHSFQCTGEAERIRCWKLDGLMHKDSLLHRAPEFGICVLYFGTLQNGRQMKWSGSLAQACSNTNRLLNEEPTISFSVISRTITEPHIRGEHLFQKCTQLRILYPNFIRSNENFSSLRVYCAPVHNILCHSHPQIKPIPNRKPSSSVHQEPALHCTQMYAHKISPQIGPGLNWDI